MLSVRVPARSALRVLDLPDHGFADLLQQIPADVDLVDAEDKHIAPRSPADRLWTRLVELDGIGPVTAGKLLARKRPRLIPILDNVVKQVLGHSGRHFWLDLRATLRAGDREVVARLEHVRDRADLSDISIIRVLDIIVWMTGKDQQANGGDPRTAERITTDEQWNELGGLD